MTANGYGYFAGGNDEDVLKLILVMVHNSEHTKNY